MIRGSITGARKTDLYLVDSVKTVPGAARARPYQVGTGEFSLGVGLDKAAKSCI
jgi:hypothetical protein